MPPKPTRKRRPRQIYIDRGMKALLFQIWEGRVIIESSGSTAEMNQKDCRKLINWLTRAAEFLEAKDGK